MKNTVGFDTGFDMLFQKQTVTGLEGNCFQAAIATLFGLRMEDMPDLKGWSNEWRKYTDRWAYDLGLDYIEIVLLGDSNEDNRKWMAQNLRNTYYIAVVKSRHLPGNLHATVGFEDRVIFDPHPLSKQCEYKDYVFDAVGLFLDFNNRICPANIQTKVDYLKNQDLYEIINSQPSAFTNRLRAQAERESAVTH